MVASNARKVECVKSLLDRGAKVDIQNVVSAWCQYTLHTCNADHVPRVPCSV